MVELAYNVNGSATSITRTSPAPYLTSAEAAEYLRYRSASGIREAVRRMELIPDGAGPRGTHLFARETLDLFARGRAESKGRLVCREVPLKGTNENDTQRHREASEEQIRDPREGDVPAHRKAKGGATRGRLRRSDRGARNPDSPTGRTRGTTRGADDGSQAHSAGGLRGIAAGWT